MQIITKKFKEKENVGAKIAMILLILLFQNQKLYPQRFQKKKLSQL